MNILKQSTAATIKLGPFIDDTDGKSAETGLTISQADIRLSKNGGDFAQTNNATGATHDEFGYYDIPLNTTDTNTLGRLRVAVSESGALPVWQDFLVVTANVYDTLCSTDTFDVNVATIATDSLTADALKADAVTKIQNGLATAAALDTVDNFLDTEIAAILADTNELQTDLVNGGRLDLLIDSIITHLTDIKGAGWTSNDNLKQIMYGIDGTYGLVEDGGAIDLLIDSIITHLTDIKGAGWTNQTLAKIVTDIAAISAGSGATPQQIWEYATRVLTAGTNLPTVTQISEAVWHASTIGGMSDGAESMGYDLITATNAIKAKTDNLPASPAPANEYDTELTAIQADLDNPNQYKADVSGIPAAVWGYATRTLSSFGSLIADIWSHVTRTLSSFGFTVATNSDANVTAIKAKTDNLPANTATALAAIQSDLDNPAQYKADVSGLATTAHVQEVENKVDLIDVTTVANSGKIDAVDAKVSAIDTDTIMSFMIDGFTFEQIIQIMASVLAGKLTRSGDTLTFRDLADTVNRVVAETDANKQRTTMTYTV